ncbi:MAG: HDOD domain-containing protein [Candidatus Zixiibacteriota bacterium]
MKQDIMHKILREHKELSSMPQVITEIINVSNDENSSAVSLSRVIMKDPNLTARLLRVVNSPFYGSCNQITTITQAVKTMGQRAVTALALAASIYNMVNNVNSAVNRKKFWRHSLEVAIAAKEIARAINYESPEEAFICGLLHDIGILVLDASFPEESKKIWNLAENGEPILALEDKYWGTNHARVGQFLLRQWGLPEILSEAVGGHHMIFGEEDKHPYQRIILVVNLANRISRFKVGNVPPPSTTEIQIRKTLTADLGLSEKALSEIELSLISEVVSESGFLEIEVGPPEEILKEANQLLYQQFVILESLLQENQVLKETPVDAQDFGQAQQDTVENALTVFDLCVKEVTDVVRKRALILKSAVTKGKIKDIDSLVTSSAAAIAESADTINYLIDEFRHYDHSQNHNAEKLSKLRAKITEHIRSLNQTTVGEPI